MSYFKKPYTKKRYKKKKNKYKKVFWGTSGGQRIEKYYIPRKRQSLISKVGQEALTAGLVTGVRGGVRWAWPRLTSRFTNTEIKFHKTSDVLEPYSDVSTRVNDECRCITRDIYSGTTFETRIGDSIKMLKAEITIEIVDSNTVAGSTVNGCVWIYKDLRWNGTVNGVYGHVDHKTTFLETDKKPIPFYNRIHLGRWKVYKKIPFTLVYGTNKIRYNITMTIPIYDHCFWSAETAKPESPPIPPNECNETRGHIYIYAVSTALSGAKPAVRYNARISFVDD